MLSSSPIRLAARVSAALLEYSKPALLAHKYAPLFPNELTRSFVSSSRVAYAPEQIEMNPQEDSQVSEKRPKRMKRPKDTLSEAKKPTPHAKKKESPAQKPITITADMLPPTIPANPFFRFVKEWYSKRPASKVSIVATAQAKEVAAEWHGLSNSEKEPYYESYRAERKVYLRKRQEWIDQIGLVKLKELNEALKREGKKQIKPPKPSPSGKPLPPFIVFANEYRLRETEKLPVREIGRRAGEAWRALSDTEKEQYHDRYKNEMNAWRERNTPTAAASSY